MSKLIQRFKELRRKNEPLTAPTSQLFDLYAIHSPSGKESELLGFVAKNLKNLGISFNTDEHGQIWHVSAGLPLLCAHTDQVQASAPSRAEIMFDGNRIEAPGHGLGADDKNGVWAILQTLEFCIQTKRPIPSFLFSVEEERISGRAAECFKAHFLDKENKPKVPFALVLDRRHGGDIIGKRNGYCTEAFEDEIARIGEAFGFKPATGAYSDADGLSKYVNCVNLSVGYYSPHSTNEYTIFQELQNTVEFVKTLLLPENINALESMPFEEKKQVFFDTEDDYDWDYNFNYGWKGGKKKSKKNAWKSRLENVYLLQEEKEYLYDLLEERMRVVEERLEEYWMGNLELDDKADELDREREKIETIMGELAQ